MSMEYRMRRTLSSHGAAIIMPVDHGLIFDRIGQRERVIAEKTLAEIASLTKSVSFSD